MGWFGGGSPSKVSTVTSVNQDSEQYLEDLPPKFEDQEPVERSSPESKYAAALSKIKLSDFTPSTYVGMPCFREAMITGFQAMGVLGVVTFLIHKQPTRSMNWAVGGFFLGNVVGFEQCRSIRRKSFETMEKARQANQEKNMKKWEQTQGGDDKLDKWKEVQNFEKK